MINQQELEHWRTLETIPKDGRPVIALYPDFSGVAVIFFSDGEWIDSDASVYSDDDLDETSFRAWLPFPGFDHGDDLLKVGEAAREKRADEYRQKSVVALTKFLNGQADLEKTHRLFYAEQTETEHVEGGIEFIARFAPRED